MTIEELRSSADSIGAIADRLAKMFGSGDEVSAEPVVAEPEKPPVTLEAVRALLAEKSRQGHTAQVRDLLSKYGADKLSKIDPKYYEALAWDAEAIGNAT